MFLPRTILLGMVEARSVNVKKTTTTRCCTSRRPIVVVVVVVVSHIQRIGCQPEKNFFTLWPIPLVVC